MLRFLHLELMKRAGVRWNLAENKLTLDEGNAISRMRFSVSILKERPDALKELLGRIKNKKLREECRKFCTDANHPIRKEFENYSKKLKRERKLRQKAEALIEKAFQLAPELREKYQTREVRSHRDD